MSTAQQRQAFQPKERRMKAFHRVHAVMAAIAAVFASAQGTEGKPGAGHQLALAEARKLSSDYESRGHGGKTPRMRTGIAAARRAKTKRSNQARHRAHCRGKRS